MNAFDKNRNRENPTFANINLLGKCNVDCYFCLGKDIPELLNIHDQTRMPFREWKNFDKFLSICKEGGINKLYITGQNMERKSVSGAPSLQR
jgi:molybdenum cofactor biosynthesis enzyme MoaA